jgi:hypothetical protein
MSSDPMYGGNHDMVVWKLIGYPGAAHDYSADGTKNANFGEFTRLQARTPGRSPKR